MKKCIVVDLDETLVGANTFHLWLKYLVRKLSIRRPISCIFILFWIFLRGTKIVEHEKLKKSIIRTFNNNSDVLDLRDFIDILKPYFNNQIIERLENKKSQEIWILATAAPEIYSKILSDYLNFDYCIATSMNIEKEWVENIKENKYKNVINLLENLKLKNVDELFTDHHDDIPLMQIAKETVLVNPTSKTLERVTERGILYTTIN